LGFIDPETPPRGISTSLWHRDHEIVNAVRPVGRAQPRTIAAIISVATIRSVGTASWQTRVSSNRVGPRRRTRCYAGGISVRRPPRKRWAAAALVAATPTAVPTAIQVNARHPGGTCRRCPASPSCSSRRLHSGSPQQAARRLRIRSRSSRATRRYTLSDRTNLPTSLIGPHYRLTRNPSPVGSRFVNGKAADLAGIMVPRLHCGQHLSRGALERPIRDSWDGPIKLHCWPIALWDWRRSLIRFTRFAGECLRF
jgi:hypothetical protein